MQKLNKNTVHKKSLPIKFMQFGEGNFLRAFVDWMIQKGNDDCNLNMGGVIVQPLAQGMVDKLKEQDNMYHVVLEGIKDGKAIREIQRIDCIMDSLNPYVDFETYKSYALLPELEYVFSNTTEAGISRIENENIHAEPPVSFPGKMTALLYARFKKFDGDKKKGLTIICCELIENNADNLKEIVLELSTANDLESGFIDWIKTACEFCNSLVDRIVPGFPGEKITEIRQELGFEDNLVVCGEYFHLWAIEGSQRLKEKLPLHKAGLNILWLDDLKVFRDKKVRVLNGAHTALVPVGLLAGHQTVKEAFADKVIERFIRNLIANEVLPNMDGDEKELQQFASNILERFLNPYLKHFLKDISLNSISKWVTRDYPSLKDFATRTNTMPKRLSFSLAALVVLYCEGNGLEFTPNDTNAQLNWMQKLWKSETEILDKITQILSNKALWGIDINQHAGLAVLVSNYISIITKDGIIAALNTLEE